MKQKTLPARHSPVVKQKTLSARQKVTRAGATQSPDHGLPSIQEVRGCPLRRRRGGRPRRRGRSASPRRVRAGGSGSWFAPLRRKAPFSTTTLKAATRAALGADCVTLLSFAPNRVCKVSRSFNPWKAAFDSKRITDGFHCRSNSSMSATSSGPGRGGRSRRGRGFAGARPSRPQRAGRPRSRSAPAPRSAVRSAWGPPETAGSTARMTSSLRTGRPRAQNFTQAGRMGVSSSETGMR